LPRAVFITTSVDAARHTLFTMPPFSITPSAPTRHRSTSSMIAPTAESTITFVGMPRSEKMRADSSLRSPTTDKSSNISQTVEQASTEDIYR
jgi:hypothetical protein